MMFVHALRGIFSQLLIVSLLTIGFAKAEIYKCEDQYGKISYSSHLCPSHSKSSLLKQKTGALVAVQDTTLVAVAAINRQMQEPWQTDNSSHRLMILLYGVMSLLCYACYFYDKRAAERGHWRISEKSLHLLELLGGWPGALFAQRSLRHKNKKLSYQLVFWLIVSLHIVFWGDTLAFNSVLAKQFGF